MRPLESNLRRGIPIRSMDITALFELAAIELVSDDETYTVERDAWRRLCCTDATTIDSANGTLEHKERRANVQKFICDTTVDHHEVLITALDTVVVYALHLCNSLHIKNSDALRRISRITRACRGVCTSRLTHLTLESFFIGCDEPYGGDEVLMPCLTNVSSAVFIIHKLCADERTDGFRCKQAFVRLLSRSIQRIPSTKHLSVYIGEFNLPILAIFIDHIDWTSIVSPRLETVTFYAPTTNLIVIRCPPMPSEEMTACPESAPTRFTIYEKQAYTRTDNPRNAKQDLFDLINSG
jgi:hypothetical protein